MVPLVEPQPSNDGQTLAHLTLAIQDWTGSAREEPIEVTHIGQVIVLVGAWRDRYLIQVLQVEPGKVSLFVNGLGLKQGTERDHRGVDLTASSKNEFTMTLGETVTLYTPTMDGGNTWELTLRQLYQ